MPTIAVRLWAFLFFCYQNGHLLSHLHQGIHAKPERRHSLQQCCGHAGIHYDVLVQVYKEGKKISEHVAQETGTGSFQKVGSCLHSWTV